MSSSGLMMNKTESKENSGYEEHTVNEPHYYTEIKPIPNYLELVNTVNRAQHTRNVTAIPTVKSQKPTNAIAILVVKSQKPTKGDICKHRRTIITVLAIIVTAGVSAGLSILILSIKTKPKGDSYSEPEIFRISETGQCGREWDTYQSYCYQVYKYRKNWHRSRDFCRSMGTDLISIHSRDEMDFVIGQYLNVSNRFWIGLNSIARDKQFAWSDGTKVNYLNWAKEEPSDVNNNEKCVQVWEKGPGTWNDNNCYMSGYFICKYKMSLECGMDSWLYFNGSCYSFSAHNSNTSLTWQDARRACWDKRAELAIIQSKNEYHFIFNEVSFRYGYHDNRLWIGMDYVSTTDTYKWVDGSSPTFVSWSFVGASKNRFKCVALSAKYGNWESQNCSDKYGYICEKQQHTTYGT